MLLLTLSVHFLLAFVGVLIMLVALMFIERNARKLGKAGHGADDTVDAGQGRPRLRSATPGSACAIASSAKTEPATGPAAALDRRSVTRPAAVDARPGGCSASLTLRFAAGRRGASGRAGPTPCGSAASCAEGVLDRCAAASALVGRRYRRARVPASGGLRRRRRGGASPSRARPGVAVALRATRTPGGLRPLRRDASDQSRRRPPPPARPALGPPCPGRRRRLRRCRRRASGTAIDPQEAGNEDDAGSDESRRRPHRRVAVAAEADRVEVPCRSSPGHDGWRTPRRSGSTVRCRARRSRGRRSGRPPGLRVPSLPARPARRCRPRRRVRRGRASARTAPSRRP